MSNNRDVITDFHTVNSIKNSGNPNRNRDFYDFFEDLNTDEAKKSIIEYMKQNGYTFNDHD